MLFPGNIMMTVKMQFGNLYHCRLFYVQTFTFQSPPLLPLLVQCPSKCHPLNLQWNTVACILLLKWAFSHLNLIWRRSLTHCWLSLQWWSNGAGKWLQRGPGRANEYTYLGSCLFWCLVLHDMHRQGIMIAKIACKSYWIYLHEKLSLKSMFSTIYAQADNVSSRRDICHKHHKQRLCKWFQCWVKFLLVKTCLVWFQRFLWSFWSFFVL